MKSPLPPFHFSGLPSSVLATIFLAWDCFCLPEASCCIAENCPRTDCLQVADEEFALLQLGSEVNADVHGKVFQSAPTNPSNGWPGVFAFWLATFVSILVMLLLFWLLFCLCSCFCRCCFPKADSGDRGVTFASKKEVQYGAMSNGRATTADFPLRKALPQQSVGKRPLEAPDAPAPPMEKILGSVQPPKAVPQQSVGTKPLEDLRAPATEKPSGPLPYPALPPQLQAVQSLAPPKSKYIPMTDKPVVPNFVAESASAAYPHGPAFALPRFGSTSIRNLPMDDSVQAPATVVGKWNTLLAEERDKAPLDAFFDWAKRED
jgi:hypothetical protein